jgi:hypothetical protein
MLPAVRDAGTELLVDGFAVGFVAEDGTPGWVPLMDAWAVRFEAMAPARRFNLRKGQRHLTQQPIAPAWHSG